MKSKVRKWYNTGLQLLIIGLSYAFIYIEVFHKRDLGSLITVLQDRSHSGYFWSLLAIVVLMMLVNWGIEAVKWRYLLLKSELIGFFRSFKAVMSGVTISLFTPNRTGEYFGRVFVLKQTKTVPAILLTIIGSLGQLYVTFFFGSFGLALLFQEFKIVDSEYVKTLNVGIWLLAISLNLFFLFLFLNIQLFYPVLVKIFRNKLPSITASLDVLKSHTTSELFVVLLFSGARYFVFAMQYYFVFRMFGIDLLVEKAFMVISCIFLFMTIIPTVALSELGLRGSVSLFMISLVMPGSFSDSQALAVISAATLLWIINLALPALIGSVFVLQLKFLNQMPHDDF